jgi:hypothetical protein
MVSVDVLIQRLNEWKAMLAAAPDGDAAAAPGRAAAAATVRPEPAAPYAPPAAPPTAGDRPVTAARIAEPGDAAPTPGDPAAVWTSAMAVLAGAKARMHSDLRDSRILSIAGDRVIVGIDRKSPERLPLLDTPAVRDTLAKVLSRTLQRPVSVAFELADSPAGPTTPSAARSPAPEAPATPTPAPGDDADKRKARKKLIEDPAVKSLMKTFGGRITDIRE